VVLIATVPLAAQFSTQLSPKTDQAFDDYRKTIEAQLDGRPRFPAGLKPGQIQVLPARNQGAIEVPLGIIHDWIAADDDQYVDIALRSTPDRLRTIRNDLPDLISRRCSPAAYTRAVEEAYRTMWETYCGQQS